MNTLFSQLSPRAQRTAMRQCWPRAWRDQAPLSPDESQALHVALEAFAGRYFANREANRAHRAAMIERGNCGCFAVKPVAERAAILAELRARLGVN